MTKHELRDRQKTEKVCREIGMIIGGAMPKGWGFSLLVFQFGAGGQASYISNAKRADMVHALREQADRLERHEDVPPNSQN